MKIDIIVSYIQRYEFGHEKDFVPPLTGIHLAGITPAKHEVRVIHQQVEPVDFDSDADVIAISFFSGFANAAYHLAIEFRKRGKVTIGGGPHVTFNKKEALQYFDSIVVGEAENVWEELLENIEANGLQTIYQGRPATMEDLPSPRYDLLPDKFFIKKVIQATRGCPFSCSFCTVPSLNPGFRLRPVKDVIRDATYDYFKYWWQRKVVWFWDDNLTIRRSYIRQLLKEMIPLKKWWLTQASMDIAKDPELLDLMKASGCIGVFLGIESFGEASLRDANKRQNRVAEYQEAVAAIRKRGIAVMAGFVAGFDHDDPKSIVSMADRLMEIGIDVPFLSVMTPFKGTSLYTKLKAEGRILESRDWNYYNGYNVAFQPRKMTVTELLEAHRNLWKRSFSLVNSAKRILKGARLKRGAFLLVLFMNAFYCLKKLRGNLPVDVSQERHAQGGLPQPTLTPSKTPASAPPPLPL